MDSLLKTIFHISNISLNIPSNADCETNEIKGMKIHNPAQSSLDALNEESTASSILIFKAS